MAKKIVFIADCLVTQKAGIHFYAKQFIQRIISHYPDNQYYIVLPHPYEKLEALEVIVPIWSWLPLHSRLRYFTSIPRAVAKLDPHLVIEMAHFGPFGLKSSIRKATIIHDLTPLLFPAWHNGLSTFMHKILLPGILKRSDYILTNSFQTKEDVRKYMPELTNKISVAYPKFSQRNITTIEDDTLWNNSERYLLAVGTIEPRKNYQLLLKSFNEIAQEDPTLKLRIVGYKGWKSTAFFDLLDSSTFNDRIILEGYTSEERLASLYKNAYAFVFPSLYEGFGLPLLEALSFGLPIICSDLATSREVCDDAAHYFSKNEMKELVQLLSQLLKDPAAVKLMRQKSLIQFEKFNSQKLELDELFL